MTFKNIKNYKRFVIYFSNFYIKRKKKKKKKVRNNIKMLIFLLKAYIRMCVFL